jgi:hypothetical protein
MPAQPPAAPKPGFVTAAVTFFTHEVEVPVEEAELFIRQGFARDASALGAAIAKARADLGASLGGSGTGASAPAPTVSGSGTATAPDSGKTKESTP